MKGMNETFKPHTKETIEECVTPQRYIDVYLEGNLRLPQTGCGFTVTMASELMSEKHPDLTTFLHMNLSSGQRGIISTAMDRTHHARLVPAGTPGSIDEIVTKIKEAKFKLEPKYFKRKMVTEERFNELWLTAKKHVLMLIGTISENTKIDEYRFFLNRASEGEEKMNSLAKSIQISLKNDQIKQNILSVVTLLRETIQSDQGQIIGKELRNIIANRQDGPFRSDNEVQVRKESIKRLYRTLLELIKSNALAKNIYINEFTNDFFDYLF